MKPPIEAAQVVLPCPELDPTLEFFTERLGFRVAAIYPADDPAVAIVSGYGLRVQLDRDAKGDPGALRLSLREPSDEKELVAPNGTRVVFVDADPPIVVPEAAPTFVLSELGTETTWGTGRAGMRYRDLVPDRQGGAFIASHIQIPEGGPVPDYVHFHKVRFQMIYCYRGWVRVVYEDQGPPFVLEAGDAVLQPPRIRHRVLEASPGLEVIEVACPARHETLGDLEMELPTSAVSPDRDFSGQRFVRHQATSARWEPWRLSGFECRDTGIASATEGVASVRVARPKGSPSPQPASHDAELVFFFVLDGALTLRTEGRDARPLVAGSALMLPPGLGYAFSECSSDLELLEVTLPARFETKLQFD